MTFCSDFDEKSLILGVRRHLAPIWGRVSELASKKTTSARKDLAFWEFSFRLFRHLLTLDFSFIFEVTSDPELSALWCRKGAQKKVSGEPFRRDFEVSDESENEAPV